MNAKFVIALACLCALPLAAQQHDEHANQGDRAQNHEMDMGCMNMKSRMEDMQKRMDAMQQRMNEMERERGSRRER